MGIRLQIRVEMIIGLAWLRFDEFDFASGKIFGSVPLRFSYLNSHHYADDDLGLLYAFVFLELRSFEFVNLLALAA